MSQIIITGQSDFFFGRWLSKEENTKDEYLAIKSIGKIVFEASLKVYFKVS